MYPHHQRYCLVVESPVSHAIQPADSSRGRLCHPPGSPFQCHGHHNLLQGSISCPLSNSIDAALDLPRSCKPCGNRISIENIRGKPLSTQEHHDLIRGMRIYNKTIVDQDHLDTNSDQEHQHVTPGRRSGTIAPRRRPEHYKKAHFQDAPVHVKHNCRTSTPVYQREWDHGLKCMAFGTRCQVLLGNKAAISSGI